MSTLDELRARSEQLNTEIRTLLEAPVPTERDAATAANADIEARIAERNSVDARVAQLAADDERRAALGAAAVERGEAGEHHSPARAAGKDLVYERGNGQSFFMDLARSAVPGSGSAVDASQRLQAHAEMMERVDPKDLPPQFRASHTKRAANWSSEETRTNPTRIGGQGGYFVPPVWLVNDYVPYLRAGRTTANLFTQMDLPTGTDSINLPKLTLGTLVGVQQDNGAVTSQDITDAFVTAPVRTIAGQEDIAIQLLDQSPIAFDEVILKDLMASYNQQLDIQSLIGTGSNGQLKGLLNIAGTNAVTYTDGSPAGYKLYTPFGQAVSQIARQRFSMPSAIVVTPQRWFWFATSLDSQNRPLVLPTGVPRFNAMGTVDPNVPEGLAGDIGLGVPVYVDANIPSNVGAGANQDTVWVAKFDDLYLFEGAIRSRALVEVLSGTLQVRVQLYNYVAALVDRFPTAVSSINGTGLVSPSGF